MCVYTYVCMCVHVWKYGYAFTVSCEQFHSIEETELFTCGTISPLTALDRGDCIACSLNVFILFRQGRLILETGGCSTNACNYY